MKVPPLLCIGHSHVACVARAAESVQFPLDSLNFWDIPEGTTAGVEGPRLSAQIEQHLRSHPGAVFSMIGGAVHGVAGMLVHPRRFDFVLPEFPQLAIDPQAEILPALAVRQMLESMMKDYLALMSHVREFCVGPMFHVEPPPPYADPVRMHADIPWVMYPGMIEEISPAAMRYKLWRIHSCVLEQWCVSHDASLIKCPPETMDADGFMREAYYGDGAHANEAYGQLVLDQMKALA